VHPLFDRLFRTFAAKENPIGFGAADFIEFGLAVFLAALALASRPWIEPWAARFAKRTGWCMLALAALPVVLRLALLAHHPAPAPDLPEEFANLLRADTLMHAPFSNPPPALPQFFEPQPQGPVGPYLLLALGRAILGSPWAGVLVSTALFCALCYWMLRAWTTPVWALAGGVLTVIEFGPLSSWMNTYTGGALTAAAACLVFGALPRLLESRRLRDAMLLALGLGAHALMQPRETIWLALGVALFFVPGIRGIGPKWTAALAAIPLIALALLPHAALVELGFRVRFYRFFLLPPLYLALPVFLLAIREYRFAWVILTLTAFALGTNLHATFAVDDIAAAAGLFVLISVTGLQRMNREAAWILLALCGAHFLFWYGIHVFDTSAVSQSAMPFETWDALHRPNADKRVEVNRELAEQPGKIIVFVRSRYPENWVHNAADMGAAQVVWARDLGAEQDEALVRSYPDRTAWVLEADAQPPRIARYEPPKPQQPVVPQPKKPQQPSPFENVP
jgi:hypothetical protein